MLAGILLFFTTPFRIEDVIEVMPDGIKGQVLAINTF
ncbi:mechanosensitive ion channel domain-containing protein [Pontiella sp.]